MRAQVQAAEGARARACLWHVRGQQAPPLHPGPQPPSFPLSHGSWLTKRAGGWQEYGVSETTLEQIFNQFAAQQEEETGPVRGLLS